MATISLQRIGIVPLVDAYGTMMPGGNVFAGIRGQVCTIFDGKKCLLNMYTVAQGKWAK